ncbi:hypothetical protein QQF64_014440 [Cirrhinus molitorella]|uniref:Uncharacterized protein n=1 Tax=Cirrhinus molitorella TaxID=172907 RepID=A0ABR3NS36_9TELE
MLSLGLEAVRIDSAHMTSYWKHKSHFAVENYLTKQIQKSIDLPLSVVTLASVQQYRIYASLISEVTDAMMLT